jgi:hypothetical protein
MLLNSTLSGLYLYIETCEVEIRWLSCGCVCANIVRRISRWVGGKRVEECKVEF